MRLSLFTPTHRPRFLPQLWNSLKHQPFDEWIILSNNGAQIQDFGDPRVRVVKGEGTYVGDLKYQACLACTGDLLVEADHDDEFLPGALEAVLEAFRDHPEAGFVYSDCAHFTETGGSRVPTNRFDPAYGWTYQPVGPLAPGLEYPRTWPPTPLAISRIWFAPDHLRAWRKEVYWAAGGHDRGMRVLDDQDLMARTYLISPFHHIDRCLYLYRVNGDNTWLQHNQEIQDNVLRLHDKYIAHLASAWADSLGLLKLDLGGRFSPHPGFTTVDLRGADICTDLRKRWPFEDHSVGVIIANDILEHLPDPIHTMTEIHRVLVHGGLLLAFVPSTDGRGAFQDPTHVSFWNENSFWYWTRASQAAYIDTPARFQNVRLYTYFPSDEHRAANIPYTVAHLAALKEGPRLPGLVEF